MPRVSAIVTTRNSGRTLRACLESLRAQTERPEIVVVDNGSTDETPALAAQLADVVMHAGPERSAQRNVGIRAASGEFVLIVDSDMILEPGVVAACLRTAGEGAGAIAIPEESFGSGYWAQCKRLERSAYANDALVQAARFFRRADLLEIGGYDEDLHGGEDWDVSLRASALSGFAVADALIRHDEGVVRLGVLFRKKLYYARSLRRFVRKHGGEALRRLSPLRGSLIANIPAMLRKPHLFAGVVVMKSVELAGVLCGLALRQGTVRTSLYSANEGRRA